MEKFQLKNILQRYLGGSVYYLYLGYSKNSSDSSTEDKDQVTINSINIYSSTDETYNFVKNTDGTYSSTNQGKDSTTSSSYIELDLTNYSGKYILTVNAEISSESSDYGYVIVNDSMQEPSYLTSTGRILLISGDVAAQDYTYTVSGGQVYYLHLGYYKNSSTSEGTDTFTVNDISFSLSDEDLYHGTITTNDDGIATLNLAYGIYTLTEISTPDGYETLEDPITISFKADEKTIVYYDEDSKTYVEQTLSYASYDEQNEYYVIENTTLPKVTVKHIYVNKDGNITETEVAESVTTQDTAGSSYTSTPYMTIDGYTLATYSNFSDETIATLTTGGYASSSYEGTDYYIPSNASGKYVSGNTIIVTYYYVDSLIPLTVYHYIEGTTTYVPTSSDDVETVEYMSGYTDDAYETDALTDDELSKMYELSETPENYKGTYGKEEITVIYYYKLVERDFSLVKTGDDGNYLEGVEFTLTDSEGNTYTYTTNSQGIISDTLEYGTYTLQETKTLSGYSLDSTIYTISVTKDGIYEITEVEGVETKTLLSTNSSGEYEIDIENERLASTLIVYHYIYDASLENPYTTIPVPSSSGGTVESVTSSGYVGESYVAYVSTDISSNYMYWEDSGNTSGTYTDGITYVYYYYKVVNSVLEASIEKTATDTITEEDEEVTYTINYSANITNYIDTVNVTISDTLPNPIDTEKSNLAGGTYDESTHQITWNILEDYSVNTYSTEALNEEISDEYYTIHLTKEENSSDITITVSIEIRVVYSSLDLTANSMTNSVTQTTVLTNNSQESSAEAPTNYHFTTDVKVTKNWEDNSDTLGIRPTSVTAILSADGYTIPVEIKTEQVLTEENSWSYTWVGLEKYDEDGNLIDYEVTEEALTGSVANVYTTKVEKIESAEVDINYVITNTYAESTETKDIVVNKVWNDNSNEAGKRPSSIYLVLYQQSGTSSVEVNTEYLLEDTTDNTTSTFKDLPVYDEYGNTIVYTVGEKEVNTDDLKFYSSTITETNENEYTITNTFSLTQEYISITVNKVWNDNETQALRRPSSIKVILMNGTTEVGTKVATADSWTVTFDNIAKYDSYGNEIQYTVKEEEAVDNDLKFYTSSGTVDVTNSSGSYTATLANTFTVPTDTQSIEVTKIWDDGNSENRPSQVKLILTETNDNSETYSKVLTTSNADSTNSSYWKGTITVPVYNSNGEEMTYSLSEEEVNSGDLANYTSTVDGYTITNSLILKDSSITKTGNETISTLDETLNYTINYNLQINESYTGDVTITLVDTLPYSIDTDKSYDLAGGEYDESSKTITWTGTLNIENKTITWQNADGSETTETVDNSYSIQTSKTISLVYKDIPATATASTITNNVKGTAVLVDTGGTIETQSSFDTNTNFVVKVVVNKLWEGDTIETENLDGSTTVEVSSSRPSSVNVELQATLNDVEYDLTSITTATATVSENGGWTYTWKNLPKYDETTKEEIKYTVVETSSLSNYYISSETAETDENSQTTTVSITNSKYGSITLTKVDKSNEDTKLGGATFTLEKLDENGDIDNSFATIELTTESDTESDDFGTLVFENLEYGTYKITETVAPEGYNLSTSSIEITLSSDNVDVSATATDKKKSDLPVTGGQGIFIILIAGMILFIVGIKTGKIKLSKIELSKVKLAKKIGFTKKTKYKPKH